MKTKKPDAAERWARRNVKACKPCRHEGKEGCAVGTVHYTLSVEEMREAVTTAIRAYDRSKKRRPS